MKIQKLVYFAHGWHLGVNTQLALPDAMLISEQVQAWKYGPVIKSIYRAFRDCGSGPITSPALVYDARSDNYDFTTIHDIYAKDLISRIWKMYGHLEATQLSKMTHEKGTPWAATVEKYNGRVPDDTDIPPELIQSYFANLAQKK